MVEVEEGSVAEIEPHTLPQGWAWTTLGEVADTTRQRADPQEHPALPYIGMEHIEAHSMYLLGTIVAKDMRSSAECFGPGDVLYGRLRPYLNKVYCPDFKGLCSAEFIVFRQIVGLKSKYLQYFLNSWAFVFFASHLDTGDRPRVSFDQLAPYPFPLPPLPEQQRIVAAIEAQFSRLDAAVAALKRAQTRLKRYRAAVLKAAVEGELTAEWRGAHPTLYMQAEARPERPCMIEEPAKQRAGRLWGAGVVPELSDEERRRLPTRWKWVKVRDLGPVSPDVVQVGPMSMRSQDFASAGIPVLNVGCVQWDRFDESKLNFLPDDKARAFQRYVIREGDVLFTRSGTVGRCAVATHRQDGWLMTFHLLRVRTSPATCLPHYLRHVLEGAGHIRRQTREASIGTTRAGFNTNLLADLDVPLPSLAEQEQIVAEVEQRLSVVAHLEGQVEAALKQAERLRQSILQQAFSGKLVPQDPSDEPASALLERIRAARAGGGAARQGARAGRATQGPGPGRRQKQGGRLAAAVGPAVADGPALLALAGDERQQRLPGLE